MNYTLLLNKQNLISFLRSTTSAKDQTYKPITDEIINSLQNKVALKYNSVYETYYRKYKFKLLGVVTNEGLQFCLYEYDFGKGINKIVGKVTGQETRQPITILTNQSDSQTPTPTPDSSLPKINSFSPTWGNSGNQETSPIECLTVVDIYGKNLYPATSVKFNGVEALVGTYLINPNGQEIQLTVPEGATTGKITVTTSQGTGTSEEDFHVIGICV